MPFQDIDEVSTEAVRTPSGVETFVRKVFVEDWSLKLLSFGIALVLWLVVTSQNEPVTTHMSVQLNFVRPQSLDIGNDPPKTVDITVTGSRSKLDNLSALDLVATLDITEQRAGERVWRLADKAQISLPQGVKVDGFLPGAVTVRLEPIIQRHLPVVPKIEGSPAEGYEVYSASSDPPAVTVRGPESRVNALDKAPTETIRLTGLKDSFNTAEIPIDISDPKVDLLNADVKVRVEIGERRVERSFVDVPVTSQSGVKLEPGVATVVLLGSSRILDGLKKEEIKLVFDSSDGTEPRLELPSALQGKVILISVKPPKFVRSKVVKLITK